MNWTEPDLKAVLKLHGAKDPFDIEFDHEDLTGTFIEKAADGKVFRREFSVDGEARLGAREEVRAVVTGWTGPSDRMPPSGYAAGLAKLRGAVRPPAPDTRTGEAVYRQPPNGYDIALKRLREAGR
jgi:hypothetical protein